MQARFQGKGLVNGEEWIYDYIAWLVPVWPNSNATLQRVALDQVCGDNWLAVGDAASAYDPLSSQGITKALRLGIFAGYAIGERLNKEETAGLSKYASLVRREFEYYRQIHRQYSAEEQRWKQNRFWHRRHEFKNAV
ncbi:NAD(P)/FAD-dependent oxidoreductase [Nostoc sp.]|uniref:NAD(P)/FAD-dependent oxidoreductase n=1 Tax=Nostoc sp. TaxID=1180 RepID=UPI002FFA6456